MRRRARRALAAAAAGLGGRRAPRPATSRGRSRRQSPGRSRRRRRSAAARRAPDRLVELRERRLHYARLQAAPCVERRVDEPRRASSSVGGGGSALKLSVEEGRVDRRGVALPVERAERGALLLLRLSHVRMWRTPGGRRVVQPTRLGRRGVGGAGGVRCPRPPENCGCARAAVPRQCGRFAPATTVLTRSRHEPGSEGRCGGSARRLRRSGRGHVDVFYMPNDNKLYLCFEYCEFDLKRYG